MNNHWHTNFPQTQEGPVAFRYRMMPNHGEGIVNANRFGLEQAQPLAHVMAKHDPALKPLIALDNPAVYTSILKSTEIPGEVIVHLRSLSGKAETVNVSFPGRQPLKAAICETEETPSAEIGDAIAIAPFGMVTLLLNY